MTLSTSPTYLTNLSYDLVYEMSYYTACDDILRIRRIDRSNSLNSLCCDLLSLCLSFLIRPLYQRIFLTHFTNIFFLQKERITALMAASTKGRAETIKALLTAPDINVNHADVSLSLLTSPLPSLTYLQLYLYMQLIFHSFSPSLSISLQGQGATALMFASKNGHAEAIKALLTASGIDVNHADVSLYLLTRPTYTSTLPFLP